MRKILLTFLLMFVFVTPIKAEYGEEFNENAGCAYESLFWGTYAPVKCDRGEEAIEPEMPTPIPEEKMEVVGPQTETKPGIVGVHVEQSESAEPMSEDEYRFFYGWRDRMRYVRRIERERYKWAHIR